MIVNQVGTGLALGVEMVFVIAVVMVGYALSQRRAGRWLRETPAPPGPRIWRVTILVLAAIFFLGPLISAARFSFVQIDGKDGFGNYTAIVHDGALGSSLVTSLEIAALTTAIMLVLMVPTVVWVRLRLPRLALWVESVSVLPIVIPPIVMGAGLAELQQHAPASI